MAKNKIPRPDSDALRRAKEAFASGDEAALDAAQSALTDQDTRRLKDFMHKNLKRLRANSVALKTNSNEMLCLMIGAAVATIWKSKEVGEDVANLLRRRGRYREGIEAGPELKMYQWLMKAVFQAPADDAWLDLLKKELETSLRINP